VGGSCARSYSCTVCSCCPEGCTRIGTYSSSCTCTNLGPYLC
jgi:hypothetical protein